MLLYLKIIRLVSVKWYGKHYQSFLISNSFLSEFVEHFLTKSLAERQTHVTSHDRQILSIEDFHVSLLMRECKSVA